MNEILRRPWLWLIRVLAVVVPRRLRAEWRREWEAELHWRERRLADWNAPRWRNTLELLRHGLGAFTDALWLQPRRWEDDMIQDIRFSIRMLLKQPGFSIVVVTMLTLGIGVTTASFTVFNALVLKPLPVADADRFVHVQRIPKPGQRGRNFSYPDYREYVARTRTMAGLALVGETGATLGIARAGSDATRPANEEFGYVKCQVVSANYFSVLGAEMAVGRGFLPDEEQTPGTHPVVVLSHFFWERAFQGDPRAVGQTIRISGRPFVIVGVTAKKFVGTTPNRPVCWTPVMMSDALFQGAGTPNRAADRGFTAFELVGRLKPNETAAAAQAELQTLTDNLAREFPGENRDATIRLKPAPGFIPLDDEVGQFFLVLPLSVGLVLLTACANAANLKLARAAGRQREIGTRLALGATRRRIVRQLLTESLTIALIGGGLGLILAWWSLKVLYPVVLGQFAFSEIFAASMAIDLTPDYRVFGFALVTALIAGTAAGLAPALQASRPGLVGTLKGEGSMFGAYLSQSRLRDGLIVAQLTFSLVLLVSAGLLVRNLERLRTIDTGFDTARLFTVEVDLGDTRARETETLCDRLEARLRTLSDVQSVSRASRAPLSGQAPRVAVYPAGRADTANPLEIGCDVVSPDYLETLGVPLTRGRMFTDRDAGAPVVVLNVAAVRKLWPHFTDPGQALGQSLGIEDDRSPASSARDRAGHPAVVPVFQVVGIARDTITGLVFQGPTPMLYLPPAPDKHDCGHLVVRTRADVNRVMGKLRAEVVALDPDATLAMKPTAEWQSLQTTPFRIAADIAVALGLTALVLASIGLYGVMSFIVTHRTREIGIRVALGARPRGILTLFLKQGMRRIGLGVLLGVVGGLAVARLLATILVDASPFDPVVFGGLSLFLTLVALLATYLPARRATRIDPTTALRNE